MIFVYYLNLPPPSSGRSGVCSPLLLPCVEHTVYHVRVRMTDHFTTEVVLFMSMYIPSRLQARTPPAATAHAPVSRPPSSQLVPSAPASRSHDVAPVPSPTSPTPAGLLLSSLPALPTLPALPALPALTSPPSPPPPCPTARPRNAAAPGGHHRPSCTARFPHCTLYASKLACIPIPPRIHLRGCA